MSDDRKQQIEHIRALLAERRKVEQWLQGLAARRSSAPLHVVERVEADYREKLAESQARLSSETGAVRSLVGDLTEALAAQDRAATAKAEERAESELRAAVGEFSEKEWDKLRAKLDVAVTALEAERDGTRRELEAMRALLDDAVPSASANDASTAAVTMAAAAAPVESRADAAAAAGSTAQPAVDPDMGDATSEPERFLASAAAAGDVTSARALEVEPLFAGTAPFASGDDAPEPSEAPLPTTIDELAFLRTVLGGSTPHEPSVASAGRETARPAARSGAASRPSTGSSKTIAPELFTAPEEPMPLSEDQARESGGFQRLSGAFGALGANTPRTSEAVKSLKCGECGTMNYPTEWYCERCGGELAAF